MACDEDDYDDEEDDVSDGILLCVSSCQPADLDGRIDLFLRRARRSGIFNADSWTLGR